MLEAKGLACARGGLRILSGVSFRLDAGQALILRGPNGSGKTTLIRTLAGLQPPEDGEIHAPPESIAYAAHADGLKSTLTVTENLAFWASVFGSTDIQPALEAYELGDLADRPAQNLSAGQKRRLALARLSLTGRPIWLLDEPTVSLDAQSVALFGGIVKDHLAAGGAALIATHIDLGFQAETLDLTPFRARAGDAPSNPFDEAFL